MEIGAVFFDAVGTVLHADPPVEEAYEAVGRRYGSRLTRGEILRRFHHAFEQQERLDAEAGQRTNEERERRRWQSVVAAVLDDVNDAASCLNELYEHFGQAQSWRCDATIGPVLERLGRSGFQLGLASNYDSRLRQVVAGHADLAPLSHLIISSEVGWKKPAPQFFQAVAQAVSLPAEAVLFVGDHVKHDYEGARATGMQAVLFDPAACHGNLTGRKIAAFDELYRLCRPA